MFFSYFISIIRSNRLILLILFVSLTQYFQHYSFYVMFLLLPLCFYKNIFKIDIKSSYLLIILFSISYSFFGSLNDLISIGDFFYLLLYPTLFYSVGFYLSKKLNNSSQLIIIFILLLIQSVYFIIPIFKILLGSSLISETRQFISGEDELAVTLVGIPLAMLVSGIVMIFIETKNKTEKRLKVLFTIQGLLGLMGSIFFLNTKIIC